MKLLVISDSHGHIANLKHIMGFAKKYNIAGIIHAGDWNTLESVETVLSSGIPLYAVLGNADIDPVLGKRLKEKGKRFAEDYLVADIGGKKIGITHKPSNNKKYFSDQRLDLIINGHLHSKYQSSNTKVRIIRPGATINGINFAVYDTVTDKIEFLEDV